MASQESTASEAASKLDLSHLPPVFVSATHFDTDDLHELEEEITEANAALTYDIHEAKIVLSRVTKKARIQFDLRAKGLWTEEVKPLTNNGKGAASLPEVPRPTKKPKLEKIQDSAIVIDDSSTDSGGEDVATTRPVAPKSTKLSKGKKTPADLIPTPSPEPRATEVDIKVVRVQWFTESNKAGKALPLDDYLSYQGRHIDKPKEPITPKPSSTKTISTKKTSPSKAILERAKEDAPSPTHSRTDRFGKRKFVGASKASGGGGSWEAGHGTSQKYAHLLHLSTTEYEEGSSSDLPEMPDWVKTGKKYACERSTPRNNPNDTFIDLLKKIKLARLLTNDEIGVRAYSTCIASLAAYPYKLTSPREILALPGCETKIANLFVEWMNTGTIKAVEEIEANEELMVLKLFYEIWGVGATTAREFYYDRGWRDLDDVVEYGWSTLTRVQQIGVKYYDEFLDLIPRAEVEEIGRIVHRHAVRVRDEGVQTLIVGGYRRGKEASGDVDMIVSHPDENQTLNIVNDIVASLEEEGWITHTLLLSLNSTNRGQQTLPFRTSTGHGGHGFDSLDKALVVWQGPNWATKDADLANDPKAKNPNIHRRVDIIITPWRTVGCAVTGWSGGTTFQRDLRRFAKNVKGWKFDSSGIRSRVNGQVVDLEGWSEGYVGKGRATTMEEAERRVFEGMGLVYREPEERCTG
ncbi:hypothetical protein LTR37_017559 [Vermiconidia calcicola]|uniref:Uncharacterized protein n=1 Tax=Vermiconidia calcicola TaxID=1690605 RepID=A0ACC3MJF1_9PEZI|nr:hypothetical protein LTR37_017559 [Vermiconidia calcicola]